ncbi:LOW QUALITY PROTEIN: hypothetical protein PHPALM_20127 [Phytophthora palmivora]|uniref:No apical meristem-associated C-terminal domain-containing protein n=1 Tax=Phytophthora palmivora TaxID=4796 RepID=A0A2P4XFP0_9STRA|nr:LOW QUALITY PROTEIN: hypothetical protein PHPALM_20127 [Phytophthora palmivora]
MYVQNASKLFLERSQQPFEFTEVWKLLRTKPKWTSKLMKRAASSKKRKAEGNTALKAVKKNTLRGENSMSADLHMRFVLA